MALPDRPFTSLAAKPKDEKAKKPKLLLPERRLEDLNLADELYEQYVTAKQMLADAESDDVPLNQKAQTMNSIVSILGHISKIRTDIYSAERLKLLEGTLLETLKKFPVLSASFIVAYEEAINKC